MNKIYIFKDFPEGEKKIIVSVWTKIIPAKKITNNSKIEQKSIRKITTNCLDQIIIDGNPPFFRTWEL